MAKLVDTGEYLDVLKELVQQGQEVSLTIAGGSMTPFLCHGRDMICFSAPKSSPKAGDIVFFQRRSGQYVVHRVLRVRPEGYYIIGDAQTKVEGPVKEEQIFAVVTTARRKGKWIQKGDFWWDFFAGPWLRLIPVRRPVIALYSALKKPFVRTEQ